MSTMPESNDLPELREAILEEVRLEPDPGFAADLRGELRGLQARATRNLWWFDLRLPIGPIRIVHDEQLVHLVDNDFRRYEYRAEYELGFEPAYGESERVRKAAEQVLAGRRRGNEIAFLGELTPFQRAVLRATSRIPREHPALQLGRARSGQSGRGASRGNVPWAQPRAVHRALPPGGQGGLGAGEVLSRGARGEGGGSPDGGTDSPRTAVDPARPPVCRPAGLHGVLPAGLRRPRHHPGRPNPGVPERGGRNRGGIRALR